MGEKSLPFELLFELALFKLAFFLGEEGGPDRRVSPSRDPSKCAEMSRKCAEDPLRSAYHFGALYGLLRSKKTP